MEAYWHTFDLIASPIYAEIASYTSVAGSLLTIKGTKMIFSAVNTYIVGIPP